MTGRPSAAARAWDAAALALVAAGAALVYRAHRGLEGIQSSPVRGAIHGSPNVERWIHYRSISNMGFAAIVAGVVIGIVAWYRSRREHALARMLPVPIADAAPVAPTIVPPNAPPG
jgi:hypothetical protein